MLSFISLTFFFFFLSKLFEGSVQLRGSTVDSWSHSRMHSMPAVVFSVLLIACSWPSVLQQVQYIKHMQDP